MDTELAKTFLEIVSTGSFVRASERLNVGQTTVGARIRLLEEKLGQPLFVRNKSGANLTPAGERFLKYAPTFVQLWERARHQIALPPGHRAALSIGSEVTLARPLLLDWVIWMRRAIPDVALRVHVDVPQDLISQVADGLVDAAIIYAPQHRPGLKIDLLMEEKLVLVSTRRDVDPATSLEYVHVDWGPEFAAHSAAAAFQETPALFIDLGPLALDYILSEGGAGYFRMSAVDSHIRTGHLHLVPDAPQFSYPIYVVYAGETNDAVLGPALAGLRTVITQKS